MLNKQILSYLATYDAFVIGQSQSPATFGLVPHCGYIYSLGKYLEKKRSSPFYVYMKNLEIIKSKTSSGSKQQKEYEKSLLKHVKHHF